MKFVWTWNDYQTPLIFLSNRMLFTIQLGMKLFASESGSIYSLTMAAAVSATLPLILLFLCGQRYAERVVHGMAHPLGAIFDIPHGVANALLLPIVMEFNAPAALDKYVEIAKAMNVYTPDMTREEAAAAAVKAVRELSVRVGIPQHLSELGIKEEDLDKLAAAAFADVCTPGNPREVSKEIILELYKKAL